MNSLRSPRWEYLILQFAQYWICEMPGKLYMSTLPVVIDLWKWESWYTDVGFDVRTQAMRHRICQIIFHMLLPGLADNRSTAQLRSQSTNQPNQPINQTTKHPTSWSWYIPMNQSNEPTNQPNHPTSWSAMILRLWVTTTNVGTQLGGDWRPEAFDNLTVGCPVYENDTLFLPEGADAQRWYHFWVGCWGVNNL